MGITNFIMFPIVKSVFLLQKLYQELIEVLFYRQFNFFVISQLGHRKELSNWICAKWSGNVLCLELGDSLIFAEETEKHGLMALATLWLQRWNNFFKPFLSKRFCFVLAEFFLVEEYLICLISYQRNWLQNVQVAKSRNYRNCYAGWYWDFHSA